MVEFKDASSVASSPHDLLRVIILQRHSDLIESIEGYEKIVQYHEDPSTNIIRARLISLFRQTQAMIKRTISEKDYKLLVEQVMSYEYKKLLEAYDTINDILDDKNIVRMDFMIKRKKSHRSELNDRNG